MIFIRNINYLIYIKYYINFHLYFFVKQTLNVIESMSVDLWNYIKLSLCQPMTSRHFYKLNIDTKISYIFLILESIISKFTGILCQRDNYYRFIKSISMKAIISTMNNFSDKIENT